jgi:hypothetical protein
MPEIRLKELRLPEFHLPEMTREDIARTINDARSEIDLGKIERPDIDLSRADIGRFVTTAAENAGLISVTRRPRPLFIVGIVAAIGLVIAAVVAATVIGPRIAEARRRDAEPDDDTRGVAEGMPEPSGEADEAGEAGEPSTTALMTDMPVGPVAIPIEPTAFPEHAASEPAAAEAAAERVLS